MKLLRPFLLMALEGLAVSLSRFPFLTLATTSGKEDALQANTISIIYGRTLYEKRHYRALSLKLDHVISIARKEPSSRITSAK